MEKLTDDDLKELASYDDVIRETAHGEFDSLREAVSSGMPVSWATRHGTTLLHAAAYALANQNSSETYVIKWLIGLGADVNARDMYGKTPLHVASDDAWDNGTAVRELIARGADVNARDNNGRTPLHYAIDTGCLENAAKALLELGADVNAKDDFGRTPMHYYPTYKGRPFEADFMLEAGADLNAQDNKGQTPLHIAARIGDSFKGDQDYWYLKEIGADDSIKDNGGRTPRTIKELNDQA